MSLHQSEEPTSGTRSESEQAAAHLQVASGLERTHPVPVAASMSDHQQITDLYADLLGTEWTDSDWVANEIAAGHTFIVKDADNVIAAITLSPDPSSCLIERLAVLPEYQGRQIGSMLIERAKEFCMDNEIPELTVLSLKKYGAAEFYIRCGLEGNPYSFCFRGTLQLEKPRNAMLKTHAD